MPRFATAADLTDLWSDRYGDGSDDRTVAVAVDNNGNIFVAGQFQGTINLGGSTHISAGSRDIYLAKYSADGTHVWSRSCGDINPQITFDLAVNSLGQPALVGSFQGGVDFGGGPLISAGGYDICVAKFDANGNHLWSRSYGDLSDQFGTGVGCGSGGHVAVTGFFSGNADFGGGPLTSAGSFDVYLARFEPIATGITESLSSPGITLCAGPNPFRRETVLSYRIPRSGEATVQVFDLRSRLVRSLVSGVRDAGEHRVVWDGRDNRGLSMASGIYFLRLFAGEEERTGRLLLVR